MISELKPINETLQKSLLSQDRLGKEQSFVESSNAPSKSMRKHFGLIASIAISLFVCIICAVLEVNSQEFNYQSWLALFSVMSLLSALILEYPVCEVFVAFICYTILFQLITKEEVVAGIGNPSIVAIGLFQPFCRVIKKLGLIESSVNQLLGKSSNMFLGFFKDFSFLFQNKNS